MKDKEIRGEGTARVTKRKGGLWDTRGRKEKRAKEITGQGPPRERKERQGKTGRTSGSKGIEENGIQGLRTMGKRRIGENRRKEESEHFFKNCIHIINQNLHIS